MIVPWIVVAQKNNPIIFERQMTDTEDTAPVGIANLVMLMHDTYGVDMIPVDIFLSLKNTMEDLHDFQVLKKRRLTAGSVYHLMLINLPPGECILGPKLHKRLVDYHTRT